MLVYVNIFLDNSPTQDVEKSLNKPVVIQYLEYGPSWNPKCQLDKALGFLMDLKHTEIQYFKLYVFLQQKHKKQNSMNNCLIRKSEMR